VRFLARHRGLGRFFFALIRFQGDGLGRAGLSRKIRAPEKAKEAITLESSKDLLILRVKGTHGNNRFVCSTVGPLAQDD
jgi:hypothetical protein